MEITTTSRRFKLTPEMKEQAEKRISKLSRYSDQILEAHLILAQEKYRQIAELSLHIPGSDLISREETAEMLTSIDRVVDRMERQLRKLNARQKDRKALRPVPVLSVVTEAELPEVEPEEEFGPVVVREEQVAGSPITVEDAIRLMREKDWELLLFPNSRSGKAALVHLRSDGNFGLVEIG
jgi:putative sigma-54 modulation protein